MVYFLYIDLIYIMIYNYKSKFRGFCSFKGRYTVSIVYYFLRKDFETLERKIEELRNRLETALDEMGESIGEDSNAWHDNFGYDEGQRQSQMCSTRLREFIRIKNHAQIIAPKTTEEVCIGSIVTVEDESTGRSDTYEIGSFWVFDEADAISYDCPLAKILIGARVGETREGVIARKKKRLKIVQIS